uniref:Uncharacterized protein n=1 Tax=Cacopsylla melanoneura TaxID=428564 RepID=A0A8D8U9F7_9HEMI
MSSSTSSSLVDAGSDVESLVDESLVDEPLVDVEFLELFVDDLDLARLAPEIIKFLQRVLEAWNRNPPGFFGSMSSTFGILSEKYKDASSFGSTACVEIGIRNISHESGNSKGYFCSFYNKRSGY